MPERLGKERRRQNETRRNVWIRVEFMAAKQGVRDASTSGGEESNKLDWATLWIRP